MAKINNRGGPIREIAVAVGAYLRGLIDNLSFRVWDFSKGEGVQFQDFRYAKFFLYEMLFCYSVVLIDSVFNCAL